MMRAKGTEWFATKKIHLASAAWQQVKPYPGTAALWIVWQGALILWEVLKFLLIVAGYLLIYLVKLALAFLIGAAVETAILASKEKR